MSLFYGTAKELRFVPDNKKSWLDYLVQNEGKKIVVNVNLDKARRSLSQNDYLWGAVYKTIADSTGSTEDELHEVFKRMFLPPKFIKWKDKELKVPGSTSELNKPQFSEYIMRIQAEVAQLGITIPSPEEKVEAKIDYPSEKITPTF